MTPRLGSSPRVRVSASVETTPTVASPAHESLADTRKLTPSPQQQAVVDWVHHGTGNAFVEALAGSGKTSTLLMACRAIDTTERVALAAFNRAIADEIKGKVSTLANVNPNTFHSFGFSAWRRAAPGVVVAKSNQKTWDMHDTIGTPKEYQSAVARLVSAAKQCLYYPGDDENDWLDLIDHFGLLDLVDIPTTSEAAERAVTERLVELASTGLAYHAAKGERVIDFDDMLWLPVINDSPVDTYDWVLVDEAQDTNTARRELARRMLKPGGRAILVGDRHQSIYGFAGASVDAVDLIERDFACTRLPLTVTYRCSRAATTFAQRWVPEITAHESNLEGSIVRYRAEELDLRTTYSPGDAILCRNTRPLVDLAFALIRAGVPAHVEGRDIGKSIEALVNKWKVETVPALIKCLTDYRARELAKLEARYPKSAHYMIEALDDRIETIYTLMEGCATTSDVRRRISELFRDTEGTSRSTVTLSTVHKAKGREWNRVFVLGMNKYMPSKWAKKEWELGQEANLIYVAVTRTRDVLGLVGVPTKGDSR